MQRSKAVKFFFFFSEKEDEKDKQLWTKINAKRQKQSSLTCIKFEANLFYGKVMILGLSPTEGHFIWFRYAYIQSARRRKFFNLKLDIICAFNNYAWKSLALHMPKPYSCLSDRLTFWACEANKNDLFCWCWWRWRRRQITKQKKNYTINKQNSF